MDIITDQQDVDNALKKLVMKDARLDNILAQVKFVPVRRSHVGFEALAWIIISQHVSTASARAIWQRFVQNIIPITPQQYLEAGEEVWRIIGLSRPKQKTFLHLCEAINEGQFNLNKLHEYPVEKALALLTKQHGIGRWTAEVYLLIAQGASDIFPAGDVALQSAVQRALMFDQRPKEREMRLLAEDWAPYRSVAALLFWAYYAVINGRDAAPMSLK